MRRKLFIIALLTAMTFTASAQKKWNFELGGGGIINGGNVENVSIYQSGKAERNDSLLSFGGSYKYVYGENNRVMNDRGFDASLNADLYQYNVISPYIAATYVTNQFKGYDNKLSLIAGAKWLIYNNPGVSNYSLSLAYVLDFVDYSSPTTLPEQVQRLSLRAKIKQKIGPSVSLSHTTYYMPSIVSDRDFCEDFNINSVTRVDFALTKNISMGVVFSYEFRNLVPEGKMKQDVRTELALKVAF